MARVLILTPQLPYPPRQGTALRNYWIVRGLAASHQIDLLSFVEGEQQASAESAVAELSKWCRAIETVPVKPRGMATRLGRMLTDVRPDMAHRLENPAFDETLGEMLRKQTGGDSHPYEIVQIEGIELARLIPLVRRFSPESRIVFDDHNAEAALQRRASQADLASPQRWPAALYSLVQTNRLAHFERWACQSADAVVTVSEADREEVAHLSGVTEITVIPNCIDVQDYQLPADPATPTYDLVFTGKMDYRPNVDAILWFADKIWPAVLARRPETTVAIVGQKPHRRLTRLQAVPGLTLTGWVERVQPYLAGAKIFIMPFRVGSGTRLKLIEAMASGLAIVSTPVGAEGFAVSQGKELLLADTPHGFADAIIELLERPDERGRLGKAAQAHAQSYDWRRVIPAFDALYERLREEE